VIAIDGPAGSGKTTIAGLLAEYLGAIFLDTGLLYRAVTLLGLKRGIAPSDESALVTLLESGILRLAPATLPNGEAVGVLLDDVDVSGQLRTPEIDRAVSAYSALPGVRVALLPIQRSFAEKRRVIMVGRDIASVVFPSAGVRIYLDASLDERARRRWRELQMGGTEVSLDQVRSDLARRDEIDSERAHSPLSIAAGSVVIQTDGKSIADVVTEVARVAEGAGA